MGRRRRVSTTSKAARRPRGLHGRRAGHGHFGTETQRAAAQLYPSERQGYPFLSEMRVNAGDSLLM